MKKNSGDNNEDRGQLDWQAIRKALDEAENQIKMARHLIFSQIQEKKAANLKVEGRVVEGVFDGEDMRGADGKRYPVTANYASKSKLVSGDVLKLTIMEDGSFVYKQIGPVERKRISGRLFRDGNDYYVVAEGKNYRVLPASVTYFKATEGDKVFLIIARDEECEWGAMDCVAP